MNASHLLFALQSALFAESMPAANNAVSIQTALLVIVCVALIFLAKSQARLRARLDQVERLNTSATFPATPAATPVAPIAAAEVSRTAPAPVPVASPVVVEDPHSVPIDILTAIAAAIHITLEGHARIVAITPQGDDRVWSLEGRRQIFHSHQVR